jgi:serine 3-dehydrogenase
LSRQFSLGLRSDLHGTGVRVTSIEPGMVETEFATIRTGSSAASAKRNAGSNPMTGEDIAQTMLRIAGRPIHLNNINSLALMPVSQSFAGFQVAQGN